VGDTVMQVLSPAMLAWIPFVEPLNLFHTWWYLLALPLSFGIAMIYKAMRLPTLDRYWQQVLVMTTQVILGMIGMSVALGLLVRFVIPMLPAE
jgi:hypothetical protein